MNSQKKTKKTNTNKNTNANTMKAETVSSENTGATVEAHCVGTGNNIRKIDNTNTNTQKADNKTPSSKGSQVLAGNSTSTAAEMTKQKKHILKQQAKQLLLKQCYKLSSNKYRHLLSLGPEHFTPREWSIIHLNYAITLQFMDKLQQALQQLNLAIKIDHLYEKPYYRRLQVLQELGLYDVVAEQAIVPHFINNPQIIALKQQICNKYHQMVGIEYVLNKVKEYVQNAQQYEAANSAQKQKKQMEQGNKILQLVKNSHNSILNKIIEQIDNNIVRIHSNRQKIQLSTNLKSISNNLFRYYAYVKDMLFEQCYKDEVSNQDHNKNIGSTSKVSIKYITLRQILQQIFELVYKLCSKYWIVNFDKKQARIQSSPQNQQKNGLITDIKQIRLAVLLLFLIHFWEMFMEQFSNYMDEGDLSQLLLGKLSGLTYDKFQELIQSNKNSKIEDRQRQLKDLQNRLGAYQQILICYCPVVLFNPQVFLSVLQYLEKALLLPSREPLNFDTAIKLLYNNNLQLHVYTLMQKDDKLKIKKDWKDQSFLYSVFGQISQSDTKKLTAFINKYLVKLSNFSGQASMISLYQQKLRQLQIIGNKQFELGYEQQTSSYKISRYKKQTLISHILLQLQETFKQCQPFPSANNPSKVNETGALAYILRQMYNIQQQIKSIQEKAEQVDPNIVGLIEDVLDVMVKNLFNSKSGKQSHHINSIKFSNIFTIYKFFHEMQPFLYRKGANKSPVKNISAHLQSLQHKLIQILLDTGTSEHILQIMKNKNDRSVQDVNAVIKYIVIVDILGYVSPSFYRKFVTSAINNTNNTSNSNDKYKMFNSVWEHLCNVEDIFITIVKQYTHHEGSAKNKADRIKNAQMDNIEEVCLLHIQCMTIMSISHPTFTSQMLSYPTILTKLYSLIYLSPLYPRQSPILPIIPLTLLFSLTTNVIEEQQAQYAQKMGTSVQEIRKAKKLQGDAYPQELLQLLDKKRGLFLGKIVGNKGLYKDNPVMNETNTIIDQIIVNDNTWTQIINHIVVSVNKMNEQSVNFSKQYNPEQKMLVSILSALSQKQPSKFRTAPIISLMFSHYKKEKPTPFTPIVYKICMYFVSILKKCNPSIFPYHQLQSLTNMPVFFIMHRLAKHELEIFQAFLGLVAVSSQNICIHLDCIYLGLIEENQYIVHGALETFNNILVNLQYNGNLYYMHYKDKDPKIKYRDQMSFWNLLIKVQQYVYKYYKIYKSLILKQLQQQQNESINTSDYSHPFKIYSTLISVILLLQPLFQTILPPTVPPSATPAITPTPMTPKTTTPELQSWPECARIMKIIQDNNGDIAVLLFKMVLHHVDRGTLPNNWHRDFQDGVNKLKIMDMEKWGKISKYIK